MPSVIYHPAYQTYAFGAEHPFSPVRIEMLLELLGVLGHPVETIAPEPAAREDILTVHDEEFVRRVEALSAGEDVPDCEDYGLGTPDNPAFPGMDLAARWLVGGTLHAARLVGEGAEKRALQLGGGLHHARRGSASGFCIYNDLAVAIRYLIQKGLWVAYLDIDVHHGDGVQQILYNDEHVLTISLHESGQFLFPGTGEIHELGVGVGRGLKLNIPLQPYTEGESYLEVFEKVLPVALQRFGPGVLLVQAGADAHYSDPLADLMLTSRDYEQIFRRILEYADQYANGKVIFTLGGGYSLTAVPRVWAILYLLLNDLPIDHDLPPEWVSKWSQRLGQSLPATLQDPNPGYPEPAQRAEIARHNRQVADRLLDATCRYWY
ncbi:MAG: acetoin utilization protein AcuC [Acidobacteriia bacterium]|nr:acetoin utilization protein AcuC [Terriglobia bacterium]